MFGALDTTFGALANVSRPYIQETIEETPPTLDQGTQSLPVIRPFLDDSAKLFADLRPGAQALQQTSPVIADALVTGTPVLRASPTFNAQLAPTARSLQGFNDDSGVRDGLSRLRRTSGFLSPTAELRDAGADDLQVRLAVRPQRRQPVRHPGRSPQHRHRPSCSRSSRRRSARTTRARRRASRPTAAPAATPATSCTPTRTRTPPPRARRASARPATSHISPAAR